MGALKSFVKHYKIWRPGILAIIFAGIEQWMEKILLSFPFPNFIPEFTSDVVLIPLRLVFVFLIMLFTLVHWQGIHYKDVTGRSLWRDQRDYSRNYWQLIRYYRNADPHRLNPKTLPIANWREVDGIILGKVGNRLIYRPTSADRGEGRNFLLMGRPGDRKTVSQIIPTALRFGGAVLAIDIKGDIYNATHESRNIKVLDLTDLSQSCCFNPLYGIDEMSLTKLKVTLEQIATTMVPADPNGKYFVEGGRDMFVGVALYLLMKNIHTSFAEISHGILHKNAIEWITEIHESDCEIAKEYTDSYYGTTEKNVMSAYGEMRKRIRALYSDELMRVLVEDERGISPQDLEDGTDIYIRVAQEDLKFYEPLITLLVQRFMTSMMSRPDSSNNLTSPSILFLLDEMPQLHIDANVLFSALATLRSKKCSIFIAGQGIGQLLDLYGSGGFRTLMGTIHYVSIMGTEDVESAKYFSEMIGYRKALMMSTNINSIESGQNIRSGAGRGSSETQELIYQPADFSDMDIRRVIIKTRGKYIEAEKCFFFE